MKFVKDALKQRGSLLFCNLCQNALKCLLLIWGLVYNLSIIILVAKRRRIMGLFGFGKKKKEEELESSAKPAPLAQGGGTVTPAFTDASTAKELNSMVNEGRDKASAKVIEEMFGSIRPELLQGARSFREGIVIDDSGLDENENGTIKVTIPKESEPEEFEIPEEYKMQLEELQREADALDAQDANDGIYDQISAELNALLEELESNPNAISKYTEQQLAEMVVSFEKRIAQAEEGGNE